ncbi:MAG: von Willebrand factor type A domain-containing protein [Oceanihabitans sp.]|nr:von Willebrand factor type A domain-containing protein [Oceanihabitans sp.]
MKKVLQFVFVLLFAMQLCAQEKTITGIVSEVNGLPLPGAAIIVRGTTIGTSTDFDGNYTIKANIGDVLLFSYLGFSNEEKTVGKSNTINVVLKPDSRLDEVVVTAMGIRRERNVVGYASQSVRSESLSNSRKQRKNKQKLVKSNLYNNTVNSLSGKVAGVNVTNNSGSVGPSSRIVIRGNSSISEDIKPLIVIDGKIASYDKLEKLKARKVEKLEVVKSEAATTLYGNKAKNGLILVKTKKSNYVFPNIQKITNETYTKIHENKFKNISASPLSTFSIDVDKASYSNIRRMINNTQTIPSDAVKIEEMVNYFDYNYSQPTGEHPFSIQTELAVTPWNNQTKLVKIGLQGKTYNNEELPASNLTFLIDVSGSMSSQNKLPLLKSAFKLLVNQLREQDKVAIVVYAGAAGVVLEPTSGKDKNRILKALDKLQSGGSTAGGEGIELAYALAQKNFKKKGNNRVILATDGDFNVGASTDADMKTLIEEKRKSGVFLSVLGFGYGNYKDSKLETLADKGNGNHAFIDTMQEAQKVFGKEFGGTLYTIAKDVKIQVEFNPNKVQAYRLIGYENRLLADEDFIDDTKDAGELGSGHTVTALYEVIPVGIESVYLKDISDLKYTKKEVSNDFQEELLTVKFRYKKPDGKKSIEMVHVQKDVVENASKDMEFAASVALFGMQIRHSQYHNNSRLQDVITLAESGRGADKLGYRAEFIRLVNSYQSL